MSKQITVQDVANSLETASIDELRALFDQLDRHIKYHGNELSQEEWNSFMFFADMIAEEAKRRPMEPLWRKAKRFAKRHGGEIVKITAAVGIGALLGISLDD